MQTKIKLILIIGLLTVLSGTARSQWFAQELPVDGAIYDMGFVNQNTGLISLNSRNLLKTVNGGGNWTVINSDIILFRINIVNSNVVYGRGRITGANDVLYKSTDMGENWQQLYEITESWTGIYFVSEDTGWVCKTEAFNFRSIVYFSTDGLNTITPICTLNFNSAGGNMKFLYDEISEEYHGWFTSSGFLYKTTNSGYNWQTVSVNGIPGNVGSFSFINKDTGWIWFDPNVSSDGIYKTINGGLNWDEQYGTSSTSLFFVNEQIGWGGFGFFQILATTTGGEIWGYQETPISTTSPVFFIDTLTGWAGRLNKTTNGGGIIVSIGKDTTQSIIPSTYELTQNYPNPFNPQTTIEFMLSSNSYVTLAIYDITGREIQQVYKESYLSSGTYKTVLDFSRRDLASGVYIYRIEVKDDNSNLKFAEAKRMVYSK